MNNTIEIWKIVDLIRKRVEQGPLPSVSSIAGSSRDPFKVLISTIISLRTKDKVTIDASNRLFQKAPDPASILNLSKEEIAALIFPAGFYRIKSKNIKEIARILVEEHNGKVPPSQEALLSMPGVGIKTANLTLSLGFNLPYICVDTHVHRICNRLGWINTKTPEQSTAALEKVLPPDLWIEINGLLVSFGQQVCTPQAPWCGQCPVTPFCPKISVSRSRPWKT
ncbi:MAG: endonuclease III [Spirochaetales bacterium]|nr:endonuclease III [Spirochaetales bacterium]